MTPQLRFPEFTDEWQLKKLGESLESISSGKSNTTTDGSVYPIYGSTGKIGMSDNHDYSGDKLLIARVGANAGSMYRVSGSYKVSDNTLIVNLKDDVDISFVQYSLIKFNINRLVFGSGQPLVTGGMLKNTKLAFPSRPEQEKIADFLTAVDERIRLGEQKLVKLEQYKRGVMQQIFSQKIRFKDENGNPYPDWEEKKFDNTFESIPSKAYQIQSTSYRRSGLYPVVDQGQKPIVGYSDDGDKLFKNSPVIVFGDHTTIIKYIDFDFIIGADGTKLLKSIQGDSLSYLYYYLKQNQIQPEGYKRHYSTLRQLKVLLPSKEEQQKIADFLTTLDEKIVAEKTKLTATHKFKKALLQRMFV